MVRGKREELREALRREPASPYRWCELGEAVLEDGQKEQARYCFQQAEKPAPNLPPMWMRAAFFHFQMEETEAAIRCSARVLKMAPDYDQAIFNYYDRLAPSVEEVLPHLGDNRRAGQAYFRHLLGAEATGRAATAWEWLREQRFADDGLAARYLRPAAQAADDRRRGSSLGFLPGKAQGRLPRIPTSCSMAISRARRPARRWTGGLRRCAARRRRIRASTGPILFQVCRMPSWKLDNRIKGEAWLDDVSLKAAH